MPPSTRRSPTKQELVYREVRERILAGTYVPGFRIVIDALAEEFGVSALPVREAIRRLEAEGLVCSGTSPDDRLVEIIELPDHPFFVASQFHPEFKSRPLKPQPLFRDFVGAATARARERAAAVEPTVRAEADEALPQMRAH